MNKNVQTIDCADNPVDVGSRLNAIEGIIVPLITSFDDQGALAPVRAEALIERHIEVGVNGFYVGGSTGEGLLQSVEERRDYLRYVADLVRGRCTLIAQVGAMSVQDAWALTDSAAECGYDAVSSTPPFYFKYTQEELVAFYVELAERSNLPVLLYNIPATTGQSLPVEAQTKILKMDNVIGSKHTDSDLFSAERLLSNVDGTLLFNGYDEMLLAGLAMGMADGIGSNYNLMPRHFIDIYQHLLNGDIAGAQESQRVVNRVIVELHRVAPGVMPGIKLGLNILGFDVGPPRKPFQAITSGYKVFEKILLECKGI